MATETENTVELKSGTEAVETIDFKMVTFSLGGKEYSIDIMKVKEISHANNFTYVPNSLPFVEGVYNLRGDIISIIDLRVMFGLPVNDDARGNQENLIILRLDEYQLGVVVDSIDKVVGINSASIQPPHPIFGDINIKFIQGVVEYDDNLYVILDVEKIFGQDEEFELYHPPAKPAVNYRMDEVLGGSGKTSKKELDIKFITETLRTFKKFNVSPVNTDWVNKRFEQWSAVRGNKPEDLQLQSESDADEFLAGFYSPDSGRFWNDNLRENFTSLLPDISGNTLTLWNPGCGNGYETYSVAVALREKYPDASIKIWANDNDLLSISNAPNLVFRNESISESMIRYTVETSTGRQFNQAIKDLILFEYHDVIHPNTFMEVDIIVARDLLSFMSTNEQLKLLGEFEEKLRPGGLLIVGKNEKLENKKWKYIGNSLISAYTRV